MQQSCNWDTLRKNMQNALPKYAVFLFLIIFLNHMLVVLFFRKPEADTDSFLMYHKDCPQEVTMMLISAKL